MMKEKKIYQRVYDGKPAGFSSDKLPNELLGTFEIIQQISEDFYSEQFIGRRKEDGKKYLVEGVEVSGMFNPENGGVRYSIKELKN